MSIRKGEDVVCLTTMFVQDGTLIRKGTVLPSRDPHVKRNPHLFMPATLGPTLDPDAMRDAERGQWAQMTASDS